MRNIHKPHKVGFFALLSALLGIGACGEINGDDPNLGDMRDIRAMYGTPTVQYSVKGKVTDEQGTPIQGLEVTLSAVSTYEAYSHPLHEDAYKTDRKGTYVINLHGFPYNILQINVKDVDGTANRGEFAPESIRTSNYTFKKDKPDKNPWYYGTADVNVPDIKLKKK